MSDASPDLKPGVRVSHRDLGEGVVVGVEPAGYVTVFFQSVGERRVPSAALALSADRYDQIVSGLTPVSPERLERLCLAIEAEELPLVGNAATLTSAKVDLLPHQVVLVHRIANASPRRFLVADEVGLGKTIETALILRELMSRGELHRALMIVPAGLVENWRSELNDVFGLDFEVFGSEGDVTDRKSNAFSRHNMLIASIDTLKRRSRIRRLLEAPPWDLIVFDEAHHLSVYRSGNSVTKTENFKLAEALRGHCRDLLLLSATPHQGDHFRFWALIRLLAPGLFENVADMVENRHRLNAVVIRRTKADACAADGSPLFACRTVHTEAFSLSASEKEFYDDLLTYLRDGYGLAARQGSKGRALGFVMSVFQKIAASSFAAIKLTLQKRLLALTIQEAMERDDLLDVDGRDRLLDEAREIIRRIHDLPYDQVGNAQTERILAEARVKLLKKRTEAQDYMQSIECLLDAEAAAAAGEEFATTLALASLPEERKRICTLLSQYPSGVETKSQILIHALKQIWGQNPEEKVVIFATYLGTVETIRRHLDETFHGNDVEVLKGGDHGAKVAAMKRFRRKDGPRVLVCTAAGREGINLQFARILFNYDLPWNPMDIEQRIGRIHRYGQESTAQVYNLVAADTIEGQIFLLLEQKLNDIARALGKMDEHGQIAEDLRGQVLGQLGSQLSYDRLYQDALSDPTLKRTRLELEVALSNADKARQVVFELFQDLERFDLGDYMKQDDQGRGMERLVSFMSRVERLTERQMKQRDATLWELWQSDTPLLFTSDRERALQNEDLHLMGLEHPVVRERFKTCLGLPEAGRGLIGKISALPEGGLLSVWLVTVNSANGKPGRHVVRIGITREGERAPWLERLGARLASMSEAGGSATGTWKDIAMRNKARLQEMLHRELFYQGIISEGADYSASLLALLAIER
ncbi:MAG: DEAD/DEAH box helicase family protein [Firmicutes bacterium]|nr:DEAD/DEAH box helicase family protein [Bacillota bacterium]